MKNIFRWMRNLIIRLVLWFVNHEGVRVGFISMVMVMRGLVLMNLGIGDDLKE